MRKLKTHELNRIGIEEFKKSDKNPIVIVLDNIRSFNNVGSAFRTADAFRLEAIYLCGITAQPPHREIHKTALGATESVNWTYFENTLRAIENLKKNNYTVVGVEQMDQSIMLHQYSPDIEKKYALVFGNEVSGISDEIIEKCDFFLEIPQFGTKHSLNVSVSIGILSWHFMQKLLK
jgi:tRNA G18 (ribose-2'-O)-methylase SpoU